MKAIFSTITLILLVALGLSAQDMYSFGYSQAETLTYADTISINADETRHVYSLTLTGNAHLRLGNAARPVVGDELIIDVTADGGSFDLSFSNDFTGNSLYLRGEQRETVTFIYNGTAFVQSSPYVPRLDTVNLAASDTMEFATAAATTVYSVTLTDTCVIRPLASDYPRWGDVAIFRLSCGATAYDAAFGSGITGPTVTGVQNKTKIITFIYGGDDIGWIAASAAVQIN